MVVRLLRDRYDLDLVDSFFNELKDDCNVEKNFCGRIIGLTQTNEPTLHIDYDAHYANAKQLEMVALLSHLRRSYLSSSLTNYDQRYTDIYFSANYPMVHSTCRSPRPRALSSAMLSPRRRSSSTTSANQVRDATQSPHHS